MKRFMVLILTLLAFSFFGLSQGSDFNAESQRFIGTGSMDTYFLIGTNLAPITNNEFNLQLESVHTQRFGYLLSVGFSNAPKYGTLLRIGQEGLNDIGQGFFATLGSDYFFKKNNADNARKKLLLQPFIGLRLIYNNITERVFQENTDPLSSIVLYEDRNTNNFSAGFTVGSGINYSQTVSLKVGIQFGYDVLENRFNDYGYTPGMGLDWKFFKTQFVCALRFKILRRSKSVTMTRRS